MPYSAPFEATCSCCHQTFTSKRLAGVEWEFNSAATYSHIDDWCNKWRGQEKADSSCGREIMTAPLAGDHIAKCLQDLGTAFQQAKATIDKRCGLHVHVNCIDYSWEDIYRLMWVYSQVEDVLFRLGGEWRKQSGWSLPISARYREIVGERFQPNPPPTNVSAMSIAVSNNAARYALNLCPWVNAKRCNSLVKTTVEFRLHEFTSDAQRVIGWTQLLVEMVDWVKKATDLEASRLSKNPIRTLCKVAPQSRQWIIQRLRQLQQPLQK